MVGYGHSELGAGNVAGAIGTLRYLAVNDATYPEYNYTSLLVEIPVQPATSAWKTRGDVKVWGYNGASGNLPTAGASRARATSVLHSGCQCTAGSDRNTPSARSSATTTPPTMS